MASPSLTSSQCSPPFPDLKLLMFLLLVWPLRTKGLALFLISFVSVYNQLDTQKSHLCGHERRTLPSSRGIGHDYDVNGAPKKQAVWLLALPRRKQCFTQLRIPGKRTATLTKTHRPTTSSPASRYSTHGLWQTQVHNTQWSRKKPILGYNNVFPGCGGWRAARNRSF